MNETHPLVPSQVDVHPGAHPQPAGPMAGMDWAAEEPQPEFNLMEYVNLVWTHRWIVVACLVFSVALAAAYGFTRPKLYRSWVKLAIEPTVQISRNQLDPGIAYWQMERHLADQAQVLDSRSLSIRVAEKLGLGAGRASQLRGSLDIKKIKETNIIRVSMVGRDAQQVSEWLNVFVEEYIAKNIEDSLERIRRVQTVIQERMDPLKEQMTSSEQLLMEFQERQDALLFADQDKNVISEQVNRLTAEYAQAKTDRIRLETRIRGLERLKTTDLAEARISDVLNDAGLNQLRSDLNGLEVELAERLRSLKEGHPIVQDLRSRIAGLKNRIRIQIDAILAANRTDFEMAKQRELLLFSNIQQLREESISLSKQTMEYDRLRREYEQSKAFYEEMMARSREADVTAASTMNNVRIIDPAMVARSPYSPKIRRIVGTGLLLGLFIGGVIQYTGEASLRKIRRLQPLQRPNASLQPDSVGLGQGILRRQLVHLLRDDILILVGEEQCVLTLLKLHQKLFGRRHLLFQRVHAL